jgi:hypothetical protein
MARPKARVLKPVSQGAPAALREAHASATAIQFKPTAAPQDGGRGNAEIQHLFSNAAGLAQKRAAQRSRVKFNNPAASRRKAEAHKSHLKGSERSVLAQSSARRRRIGNADHPVARVPSNQ